MIPTQRSPLIQYLEHSNINFELWDQCVLQSKNPLEYGLSWYLDVVCDQKWDALILDDYEAVMPLCFNSKWGLYYIYQPLFAQQFDVFAKQKLSSDSTNDFLKHIPAKFKYIEMCISNSSNNFSPPLVKDGVPNTNIVLSLEKSYPQLYHNYSTNLKRNLKKIHKGKLTFSTNIELQQVIELFKNAKGLEYSDMGSRQYQTLSLLNAEAIKHKQSWCVGVSNSGSNELIAGALLIVSKQRMIFLFSGVSAKGRDEKAMFYLIDQLIQSNAGKEFVLDFEGSNDAELARFYKGFGGSVEEYLRIKINRLPRGLKWLKK